MKSIRILTFTFLYIWAGMVGAVQLHGEALYRQGILGSGKELIGERANAGNISGMAAACVNCHRRSGLGTNEGQIVIPPIIGKYLLRPLEKNIKDLSLPHVQHTRIKRSPYTDETLARVIREGIDTDGRALNYLMPQYKLDDADMAALIAYLKQLDHDNEPGVDKEYLHFATIITPDADPMARKAMLEVMEKFIADKNGFQHGGTRPIKSNSRAITYRVKRRWQLHVWDLSGAPETWQQQLRAKLAAEPVLAAISGLGGKTWEPVHRFCEEAQLPCLFPNVDTPIDAEQDFYSLYFTKGLLLEPELIINDLQQEPIAGKVKRIVQVYRQGDVGGVAAKKLEELGKASAISVTQHELPSRPDKLDLQKILHQLTKQDVLVLWLRPDDLAALPALPSTYAGIYISGTLGTPEHTTLPAGWHKSIRVAYPYDLPDNRLVRMNYPLGWFRVRRIAIVNERIQSDTYLACGIVSETLNDVLDSFVRDYLVERIEVMLSRRLITGYYPRLSLAQGQRFASKGGFIARYASDENNRLVADRGWIIP